MRRLLTLIVGALLMLVAFAAFTAWRLAGCSAWLDANGTRFTGLFLHGILDIVVSSLWPLGEPQLGAVVIVALAGLFVIGGRWRLATVAVACYAILTMLEVGLRVSTGLANHSMQQALIHGYPSGHTARVPFFGGVLAALVHPRLRWFAIVSMGLIATGVALDRVDSTLQTTSDVIGGLLLGSLLAFTFAAVRHIVEPAGRQPATQ